MPSLLSAYQADYSGNRHCSRVERWDKVQPTLRRIDECPCKRSLNSGPSRLSILRGLVLGVFDFWSQGGFIELSWNRDASLATNLPPRPISSMHAFRSSNLGFRGLRLSASVTSPRDPTVSWATLSSLGSIGPVHSTDLVATVGTVSSGNTTNTYIHRGQMISPFAEFQAIDLCATGEKLSDTRPDKPLP
ncbi:hypothetical protein ASPVEDRAFT_828384 [Aspergillus versicolor CBS 583.65]|uniref:Uncharacterized protein n=1 Tax=Aspergillus versicolor CBS 583.65 TaxID=1036611 RepID=A0A1L9PTW6_ASPVE|nr:uncharacterized protein ASPVEDRAFT_828384 [Aspergillus versicolor CBS 583.65]OJJ04977.1 hypothetical protein ASPVEDRAFT_828384 [Aspergillus versicolor CBS 583.65]